MNGCVYQTADGKCEKFTDEKYTSFCVKGPCEYAKPSNADRIRDMTDEELARFISRQQIDAIAPLVREYGMPSSLPGTYRAAAQEWLDWLKQEVEE